jgi:chemotaxis protein methyltransferase WspC
VAFAIVVRIAMEGWLPQHLTGKLRILSLPCSSGEEAYSIIMALMDAGMPVDRFQVDAMDISSRALACAQRGVYGKNAFRGKDLGFRERHFRRVGEDFVLNHGLRQLVHLGQTNLLSPDFAAAHPQYDVILFRNLLIYLDRDAQNRALLRIDKLLGPGGVLFVGAAEQPIVLDWGFVSVGLPSAFACVKRSTRQPRPAHAHVEMIQHPKAKELGHFVFGHTLLRPSCGDLDQARRLADAGRLTEAAAICAAHLRQDRCSAQAYYLLGLIREARGDPSAVDCYRKALYLEPNHYETLVQLAVLAEQKGDVLGARNFQRRVQRIQLNNQLES